MGRPELLFEQDVEEIFQILVPTPSPFQLIRVGGVGDGAYLVPDDLSGIAACFSPGVNNAKAFEDELADVFRIPSYMCDFTSDPASFATPMIDGLQSFEKKWLDVTGAPDSISLKEWVIRHVPDPTADLLLQMDIEGAEYRNLLRTPRFILRRFRIIVVELHGLQSAFSPDSFNLKLGPTLSILGRDHRCVHVRANNCCGEEDRLLGDMNVPRVLEATFLRRDRFPPVENDDNCVPVRIPHEKDIARNVQSKAPLHLNAGWLGRSKEPAEVAKEMEDWLDFERWRAGESERVALHLRGIWALLAERERLARAACAEASSGPNVAAECSFVVQDAYGQSAPAGSVMLQEPFLFHTAFGDRPTVTIDLGAARRPRRISVRNRSDMAFDRAEWLMYCLHDGPSPEYTNVGVFLPEDDFLNSAGWAHAYPRSSSARYLSLFLPVFGCLHLSDVCVYE